VPCHFPDRIDDRPGQDLDDAHAETGTPMTSSPPPGPPDEGVVSPALLRALAAHPELMADLIPALNVPIRSAEDLLDLMGRASREAVRLLDDVQWAGVTAQFPDEDPFTTAHTDDTVLIVDEYQYAQQDGPCLQAMRTDRRIRMTLTDVRARWPQLADGAQAAGVHSFLALPLHVRDQAVGSMNLYSSDPHGFADPEPDPDILAVLTEYLDRGLTTYTEQQPTALAPTLRAAMTARTVIEQAVGVLMATNHINAGHARDLLRRQAHGAGVTTVGHAEHILDKQQPPTA
jgi:GAF domain-containing protein